jgi:DNA-binding NtrC family response regulator
LVVDDESGMPETMSDILSAMGYLSAVVDKAEKAIELMTKVHFDVVLLDIVMSEMKGVDAYNRIKDIGPNTKIIMMTGYSLEPPLV